MRVNDRSNSGRHRPWPHDRGQISLLTNLGPMEVLSSLGSGTEGLTESEAARRLGEYGRNSVEEHGKTHLVIQFIGECTHFFALILWVAAGIAVLGEYLAPHQGMAQLAIAIVIVVLLNAIFSFLQEYRAERALEALRRMLPPKAKVIRDGRLMEMMADLLVPGDIFLVEEGDKIAADGRIIESLGLNVNLATLTGESLPQARSALPEHDVSPLEAKNILLAGTVVINGSARAVAYATGKLTEFGQIAHMTQMIPEQKSPLQREMKRISIMIGGLALILGGSVFAMGQVINAPFWDNFIFAIGIIVALVPEGLLPTLTLSLALATQRMARRNALVRHLPAVEALGGTTVICTDKTGTLTENRMTVSEIYVDGMRRGHDESDLLESPGMEWVLRIADGCHTVRTVVREGKSIRVGDGMEIALVDFAMQKGQNQNSGRRVWQQGFDSERKRMSVGFGQGSVTTLLCKGALQGVLPVCKNVNEKGVRLPLDAMATQRITAAESALAERGLRVIAMAFREFSATEVPSEEDLVFAGLIGLHDPVRPEVPESIQKCHLAGIRVIMLTGDHPVTAITVARKIGLLDAPQAQLVLGSEISKMSASQLGIALDHPHVVVARVTADQKRRVVQALQQKGHRVALTGDGVNDAPALKTADVGVAMGISGTDVAKEAADVVLMDDNFATIVAAIEEGRAVYDNIRKFLTYILASNVPELIPCLASMLFQVPLPLSGLQVLAIDLGTDMFPAIALGTEPPEAGVMSRPPRGHDDRLLNGATLFRAYLWLGLMESGIAMLLYFMTLREAGWQFGDLLDHRAPAYTQATTTCFASICTVQLFNAFNCRHASLSLFDHRMKSNPSLLLCVALGASLVAFLIYHPVGHLLFSTDALDYTVWMVLLPLVLTFVTLEEARKSWVRFRAESRPHPLNMP
jgi:sodium/potassium-transporting ATPase subunit alpha